MKRLTFKGKNHENERKKHKHTRKKHKKTDKNEVGNDRIWSLCMKDSRIQGPIMISKGIWTMFAHEDGECKVSECMSPCDRF